MPVFSGFIFLFCSENWIRFFSVKYNPDREEDLLRKLSPFTTHIVDTNNKPVIVAENYVYTSRKRGVKVKVSGGGFQNYFSMAVCKNI